MSVEDSARDTRVSCAESSTGIYSHKMSGFQRLVIGSERATHLATAFVDFP